MTAAALAYTVRTPHWVLTYAGVNITADVSSMVVSVTYTDRLGGAAGEAEVEIEDHAKLWQDLWYPALGDRVNLLIGYRGEELLPCGDFQVDDLELAGPPDTMHLRCLAAYVTPAMRTAYTIGYENQSVLGIARAVAAKYGLEVAAAPGVSDIQYARVTQRQESDLEFLRRLAREHDYDFTVRGARLVFYARTALESAAPVATITRQSAGRFNFRSRTHAMYSGAQAAYQNPDTKRLILQTAKPAGTIAAGDTLKIVTRCENGQQAAVKAQAALHRHDMIAVEAALSGPGSIALAAGNTVALGGWGKFDGNYLIETARHRLSRANGYTTEVEARNVA
ncbi:MAG: phage late control D family protein [Candidatus Binataceae bacterium]